MEYGLIKDTTLTALADSFREKGIVPMTRLEDVVTTYKKYKSSNATSLTDPTPISRINDIVTVEAVEGAASMDIEFNIGYEYISGSAATLYVKSLDGSTTYWEFLPTSTTDSIQHVHVDAPAVKIEIELASFQKSRCAWTASVYYYDSANNIINAGSDVVEVVNTITPEDMAEALTNFDMPVAPPEEVYTISGDVQYLNYGGKWDWFFREYENRVKMESLTLCQCMFQGTKLTEIPCVINIVKVTSFYSAFNGAQNLRVCPKIRGTINLTSSSSLEGMLSICENIRDFEDLFEPEMLDGYRNIKITSSYSVPRTTSFSCCRSLRRVPSWWYKFKLNEESTAFPYSSYTMYYYMFNECYALDEAKDIPVWRCQAAQTSNMFQYTLPQTRRLKSFTFETDNSQPMLANWKNQTLDLSNQVGFGTSEALYNSGITSDKKVTSDETYQALKNDPDWYTICSDSYKWSRYNHDSAVETINSLPDTMSAGGGSNTIKFKGAAGSNTDGGAINTLTAEEIAVAAAKGWTVTLV